MSRYERLSRAGVTRYPLEERPSKVSIERFPTVPERCDSFEAFEACLPDILKGSELKELVLRLAEMLARGGTVALGIGGHVLKTGLGPLVIDLMRRGYIHHLAMNGSCLVHDFEIAVWGQSSEDVAEALSDGSFGFAERTGQFLNRASARCALEPIGLGEAVCRAMVDAHLPHLEHSVLAQAWRLGVPVSVHVAVGTDILHMHPEADGAAIGAGSLVDFEIFAASVSRMVPEGAYLNWGSAVLLPEVFLKVVSLVRNLGHAVTNLTTANFDMIHHYRPSVNVVSRPTLTGGRGFNFIGHHEINLPLFYFMLRRALDPDVPPNC